MRFSGIEMVSIMKLAMQMAAADGKLADEELATISSHAMSFGIEEEDLKQILTDAASVKPEVALSVVANMTPSQKRYVTAYLGTIVAVDGDIDDSEIKLWSLISALCDLPTMSIREATKIMATEQL